MSLEFALQKYPKEIKLKEGSKPKLRPLRKDDEKGFHEFFLAVPEPERMFIKHRVVEPQVIRDWCQNIDRWSFGCISECKLEACSRFRGINLRSATWHLEYIPVGSLVT